MKIQEETAEVLRDVDKFLNHPWGRISFDMTMSCIKSREASGLAQTSFAVQGFVHALQLVLLEDVLDIEKSMPVDTPVFVDDDSEEEGVVVGVVALAKLIGHGGSPSRLVSRLKGESGAGLVGAKVVAPKAVAPVTKGKVKPPTRAKKAVQPKRKRMRVDGRLRQIRDDDETETATDPVGDESKTAGRKETMEDFRTDSQQREASVTMDDVKTEQRDGDELDDVHPDDTIKSVLDSLNLSGEAKDVASKSVNDDAECQGKESSEAGTLSLFPTKTSAGSEENLSGERDVIDKKWLEVEKNLAVGRKINFGGSLFLVAKDMEEILGLQVVIGPWMMDSFIKYFRDKWATLEVSLSEPRVVFQGSKFDFLVLSHRIKFENSVKKKYVFDQDLMLCFPLNFDTLYFPFNFDKQHWIGMCLDIRGIYLYVFDCNQKMCRDTRLRKEMETLLEMLLFVVRQVSP
ncbi:hypothetical protein ARALYDRAFT_911282 [Arabidopsis lyrata subsp. lyrata]|uniref:Ubiquitin-like protease family profile domain-containing protein n=1 Tax=Arabidopsis lyrata subsp. lyrata TaxID=81972 RepID=D7LY02_ARALL|nr:hypothetical protein ARALYDRAFT_911282 [Arabidopsis lyrata subsp. lyrata]